MHKSIFHSDTLCPILAGMICICCLLSGCRMQARTEMFPSKEGYLITIGEDPTDRDTRWAKYLYEHLKKRANHDELHASSGPSSLLHPSATASPKKPTSPH